MKALFRWLFLPMLGFAIIGARPAFASWAETRITAYSVQVTLDRSGDALVSHVLTLKVLGGALRSLDIPATDPDAVLADASATELPSTTELPAASSDPVLRDARPGGGGGAEQPATPVRVSVGPDGTLHVAIERTFGLRRGTYLLRLGYRTHLLSRGGVERDGSMLRVRWSGPGFNEGIDNVRCTFLVPAAPTAPRVGDGDGEGRTRFGSEEDADELGGSPVFLSEVHRAGDFDRIELLRPHVARGEAVVWTIRVDPRALGEAHDPRLAVAPAAPPLDTVAHASTRFEMLLGIALAVIFSGLTGIKFRQVEIAARDAGVAARPLLPMPLGLRILLAGPALALGILLERRLDDPRFGAALVLAAAALIGHRAPRALPAPRGPGRWLALTRDEAFAPRAKTRWAWLDASTNAGRAAFLLASVIWAGAVVCVAQSSRYDALALSFDAVVLLCLFGTGTSTSFPPRGATVAAPQLARLAARLGRSAGLRVVPWARVPEGASEHDELRLLVVPRIPLRGLLGIEVGYVHGSGGFGSFAFPEVLVRVIEGTAGHEAVTRLLYRPRWVRGRKPDERVVTIVPAWPTTAATALLVLRLVSALRDAGERPRVAAAA